MKLTRTFKTKHYSTNYTWSAFIEGEELCYQVEVNENRFDRVPTHVLELQAKRAIMKTIEKKLFGD